MPAKQKHKKQLSIIQPEKAEDKVPLAVLAVAIRDLAAVGEQLKKSNLTNRAIEVLLYDLCKTISKGDIRKVLDALPKLSTFLKN